MPLFRQSTLPLVAAVTAALAAALASACATEPLEPGQLLQAAGPAQTSAQILIDQFGYRPADPKVAVLVDPQQGFNAQVSFTPGTTYEVRRWSDGQVVFSGSISAWQSGQTQSSSGDRGWWLDFSPVKTPGSYYLYDQQNQVGSYRFEIGDNVYRPVLIAATRMFFYNRSGCAKKPPHTDARWQDEAAYLGTGQDGEARLVTDKSNASTALDLRGGWFDAGDTNKYVTFTSQPVHQLLSAYEEQPAIWSDDFGIPESKNGVPDLIDEVKWEIDWLKRMQRDDGGVLIKVGTIDYSAVSPPSQDKRPRYYAPRCSSSTLVAAGIFAHAALVFGKLSSLTTEAADLKQRATKAWTWAGQNTWKTDCDTQEIKSGDADRSLTAQAQDKVVAAIYLFALTGDATYHAVIKSDYTKLRPYQDIGWSRYEAEQGEALLYYTRLAGADATLKQTILSKKKSDATTSDEIYAAALAKDLYRAYITDATYHWGSHQVRANNGNSSYDVITYGVDPGNEAGYRARALGIVNYIHGVNPLGMVYLSNMYSLGAEVSANEIYHQWFDHGTAWDNAKTSSKGPAPGYLPGGPNASYSGSLSPPKGEPAQKAYKDWNTGYPESSWEITEPGIYYQAAYVKLLSKFVSPASSTTGDGGPRSDGGPASGDGARPGDGRGADDGAADEGEAGCECAVGRDEPRSALPALLGLLVASALLIGRGLGSTARQGKSSRILPEGIWTSCSTSRPRDHPPPLSFQPTPPARPSTASSKTSRGTATRSVRPAAPNGWYASSSRRAKDVLQ